VKVNVCKACKASFAKIVSFAQKVGSFGDFFSKACKADKFIREESK
jgi:hypothetical protein